MATNEVNFIDLTVNEEAIISEGRALVSTLRPDWNTADIKETVFTDGISNKLVGFRLKSDMSKNDLILVRVFGAKTELIIDRDAEMKIIAVLNKAGLCKPLYAKFNNGLAYGFVPGECIDKDSVRDDHIASLIAREITEFSSVQLPVDRSGVSPVSPEPVLFTKLRGWLSTIPQPFPHADQIKRFNEELPSMETLRTELDVLERELRCLESPVVFCHNDLLLNNIVYNKEEDRTYFIDFEYGAYNYEAFEIGNHFCEYAGVDEVNFDLYPDKPYQLKWLRRYLEHSARKKNKGCPKHVSDDDVERLFVQVNKFALAAHYWWGVWGILQACFSTIDFDFLGYAALRLNEYFRRKEEFLALKFTN